MKAASSVQLRQAFSLVEMLVVIAVIAIIAAVAIPNMLLVTQNASQTRDERNAQTVAHLAAVVRAGGATNQWTTIDEVVDDLEASITITIAGTSSTYGISPMSPQERIGLTNYLAINASTGQVNYLRPSP